MDIIGIRKTSLLRKSVPTTSHFVRVSRLSYLLYVGIEIQVPGYTLDILPRSDMQCHSLFLDNFILTQPRALSATAEAVLGDHLDSWSCHGKVSSGQSLTACLSLCWHIN